MFTGLYRFLTDLGAPAIGWYLNKRRAAGREDVARFAERLGTASCPRPTGHLIWCHAASVGEAASLLAVVEELQKIEPVASVLVTTGTVTSAHMLETRLPKQSFHQYIPVDRGAYVEHFLDHWKPDLALWVESELWPNMLAGLKTRGIPAVLLNARMSEKSFCNWSMAKPWAREILSTFDLCLTQTEDERARFANLGARRVMCVGNIKYAAKPLPYDEQALATLKNAVDSRPLWLMASTHAGEEEIACVAHKKLVQKYPDLLTIIVPRHAVRGDEAAKLIGEAGLSCAQRSKNEAITSATSIYLGDTMGELGLFYRLSPIAAIGGSFANVGGHNLIEPAQLGAAVIFGPHMRNFLAMAEEFTTRKAGIEVKDENALVAAVDKLLSDKGVRDNLAAAAKTLADEKRSVLTRVMDELKPWLNVMRSAA